LEKIGGYSFYNIDPQVEGGILQGGGKFTYVEVPTELSIEIDSPLDLAFAEQVPKSKHHRNLKPFYGKRLSMQESFGNLISNQKTLYVIN
jgi:hypothetical protein